MHPPRSSRDLIIADPHRLSSLNTVYTTGTPGVPDRPHRQQEARAHDAHEVRLLPAEQRRQPRGDAARAKGAKVRRVLPVSVVVNHIHRALRVRRLANMTRRLQQHSYQVGHREVSGGGRVRGGEGGAGAYDAVVCWSILTRAQEYFADYAPLLPSLFSLNQTPSAEKPLYGSNPNSWNPQALERAVQGITAVLLSLKKKPTIRYEKMSGMAHKLAGEIQHRIHAEEQLFDFRPTQIPPLLLILDRRNDPVTPLLSQWTYQAMVHELLGIQNGRVSLRTVPDIRPELSVRLPKSSL